jgi:YegS/Rv2252/BmrU family lipid kinase
LIDEIRNASPILGAEVTVETTSGPGDGVAAARRVANEADVIGILGGDGTVHEVVNGLMPDPKPIVILPAGTGNDYASMIRCPTDIQQLSRTMNKGYGARLDVLQFGNRYCVNTAGLGFEGQVNQRSHAIKRIQGAPLYLLAVFKTLSSLRCPPFNIVTPDGERIEGDKLLVSIGNGNRTGGAFYLTPDACPDDGLVDVCVVEAMNWFRVLRLLPKSFSGKHTLRAEVRMLRVPSLNIETDPEFPMHIDGELVESAPASLRIRVLPRVLPVLCEQRDKNVLSHPLEKII